MIPSEIFSEDLISTLIRYGLYVGALFQIFCLFACVQMSSEPHGENSFSYEKMTSDTDDCSSEQSSPGHRPSNGKSRKQDKKKRR